MKKNSLLLVVNTFPDIKSYLDSYIHSINNQSFKKFDILIVNQGIDKKRFNKFKKKPEIIMVNKNKTVAEVRQIGWDHFYNNSYKYIVCSDADDFFSKNRIEKSFKKLQRNAFVYNNLIDVDKNGKKINNKKVELPNRTNNIYDLFEYNYIGGSSCAYKKTNTKLVKIPKTIVATDWWIASIYLLNGLKGSLIEKSYTFYRQHGKNIVGTKSKINNKSVNQTLKIKLTHYKEIIKYCKGIKKKVYVAKFDKKYKEYKQLSSLLKNNKFKKEYIKVINKNYEIIFSYWWSELITLNEFERLK